LRSSWKKRRSLTTSLPVNTTKGDQFAPHYLAINPNNKIPTIVDFRGPAPQPVFESGAILLHLAQREVRFLPSTVVKRSEWIQWLMWQMGGFGPMLGQAHHFRYYAPEQIPYAVDRYSMEAHRSRYAACGSGVCG
jgi:GST-like protein